MTTEPKKRHVTRNGPLSAIAAAGRLATLIGGLTERIEKARDEAEMAERVATGASVDRIMSRVPEPERQLVGKVLLALGCDLSGFELVPSNDASSPASASESEEVPKGALPLSAEREAIGKGGRRT